MNLEKKIHFRKEVTIKEEIDTLMVGVNSKITNTGLKGSKLKELLEAIQKATLKEESYAEIKGLVNESINETKQWHAVLEDLLKEIEKLEIQRIKLEQFSEKWYQHNIANLLTKVDLEEGLHGWIQLYTEALIAWELGICKKLCAEPFTFLKSNPNLEKLFSTCTQALLEQRIGDALEMLNYLTHQSENKTFVADLNPLTVAILEVFIGRYYLYQMNNQGKAYIHFMRAIDLAPKTGHPYAALACYYLLKNESDRAYSLAQEAIEYSNDLHDGYVALGLWAENAGRWDEANEFYEQAITKVCHERDPNMALSRLLAPVTGNLLEHLARCFYEEQYYEAAINCIDQALSWGVKGSAAYADSQTFELKGKILQSLAKPNEEIAIAYFESGRRYYWSDDYLVAIELLSYAAHLNPDYISTYWYLADAFRMASYIKNISEQERINFTDQSLEAWNKGRDKSIPDEDHSWVYLSRALINERLATFGKNKIRSWELYWEAIAYLEEAVILNSSEVYRWAYMARYYRYLELESCSLQASMQALGEDGERNDPLPLEERAAILANTGNSDEALTIIEKRRSLGKNLWADGVKAYILYLQGRTEEALELINKVMEEDKENSWNINFRAQCFRVLNDLPQAAKDYEFQWSKNDPSDESNKDFYAQALLWLSCLQSETPDLIKLDQAIDLIHSYEHDPADRSGYAYEHLGLCYLIRGDIKLAEEFLTKRIQMAINPRQLDELENLEFKTIERLLLKWPYGNKAMEVLKILKDQIKVRKQILIKLLLPVDEIKNVRSEIEALQKSNTLITLGLEACLARQYSQAGDLVKAAVTYQRMLKNREIFPEAFLGFKKMMEKLLEDGDRFIKENDNYKAHQRYQELMDFKDNIADLNLFPDILCRMAFVFFAEQDLKNARQFLKDALSYYHKIEIPEPGKIIGEIFRSLLRNETQYWILIDLWKSLIDEVDMDNGMHLDFQKGLQTLQLYLDDAYRLSVNYGKTHGVLPVVTPIAIEISHNLIPKEGTDRDWPLLQSYLPEMRSRIKESTGVEIPGIRVRDIEDDMPPDSFAILFDEIPLPSGYITINQGFVAELREKLIALGIPEDELEADTNPITGEKGCWINKNYHNILFNASLQMLTDPGVFMIKHIEHAIRKNLSLFMGIQEADNVIEIWQQTGEEALFIINQCLPDSTSRYRFARVLRALVKEQVPILKWKEIFEVVQKTGLLHNDITKDVSSVRFKLKKELPGNQPFIKHIKLPEDFEKNVEKWIWHTHGKTFFSAPPEETQNLLNAVRELVGTSQFEQALIAKNDDLRPFIKRLVELEFPNLMVMSENEVLQDECNMDSKIAENKTLTDHE